MTLHRMEARKHADAKTAALVMPPRTLSGGQKISRKFSRPWFDEDLREAIKKTTDKYREFQQSPTEMKWTAFKQLRAQKARLIRKKKTHCWEKFLDDFNEAYRGNHKQLWNITTNN